MIKLICGRSRAGKTTYSKRYDDVIHLDLCGGLTNCYDKALEKVRAKEGDVIMDGVYNTIERRTALLEAYKGGGEKVCIWLDTPLEVIEQRFFGKWKPMNLPHLFEPPTLDEGWDEIVIIRGDDNVERISRKTED